MASADDLRAAFPLTLRHLGQGLVEEYLAARSPLAFTDFVAARFSQGTIPHRAARDLARYEAEMARLLARPALAAPGGPLPGPDVPLRLSPDVALVNYGADLPGMLDALREGKPAEPRPRRAWLLLLARGGSVETRALGRDDGWTLEWFREPTTPRSLAGAMDEDEPLDGPWAEGVLVRA